MRKFWWLLLVLATAGQAAAPDGAALRAPELKPLQQQGQAAHLAAELLNRYHYKAVPLDDALSEKIFDQYLKALDGDHLLFLQSDVDQWAGARARFDDAILGEELTLPFAIYNRYAQRLVERFTYSRGLLKGGFDFTAKESYQFMRENAPWPKSEGEMRDLWRQRVKNDWLHLKLTGKEPAAIAETLDRRYQNYIKRIQRTRSEDAFQVFMNAYTMAVEPHTNYMGPRESEDFDISMRLSLVGIGAVLEEKDEYTTIKELVPGGPAALSGQLKVGDRIVAVGQGAGGALTDVLGWRLDETVALIRGTADTVVRLDVLPVDEGPDAKPKRISLVRKKVDLKQQAAKKSIITVSEAGGVVRRIGVITLPTFYQDFAARQKGDPNFRSATRDVTRLVDELKAAKVDGVLMDLRNNGGGSLVEAIELTGLFIDTGPVVQERDAKGKIVVDGDSQPGTAWEGPLGVLINRGSASASEIFAAAIQDYQRGVVIGETSFGKGTVQSIIDLDRVIGREGAGKAKYGELKLTIAQFFRINGSTTQLRGVQPDIALPAVNDDRFGESSFDNALPWMRIQAASYMSFDGLPEALPVLQARHNARVRDDKAFQLLQEDIAELEQLRKKNEISLNESDRRQERAAQETRTAARKSLSEALAQADGVAVSLEKDDQKGAATKDGKAAAETGADNSADFARDVFLKEAAHVVSDKAGLLRDSTRFAARLAPVEPAPASPR